MQKEDAKEPKPHDFDTLVKSFELTAGGLPKLLPDEIEIITKEDSSLFALDGDKADERYRRGKATLTTHRILWSGQGSSSGVHVCIPLSNDTWFVIKSRTNLRGLCLSDCLRSARAGDNFYEPPVPYRLFPTVLCFFARALRDDRRGSDVREAIPRTRRYLKNSSKIYIFPVGQVSDDQPAVMLSVKNRDEFYGHLESALDRKAWVKETALEVMGRRAGDSRVSTTANAGIAGILRRQEANRKATAEIASEAFSDLQSLIDKAKEVVAVVERYSAALQEKKAREASSAAAAGGSSSEAGGKSGSAPDSESEDLSNILLDIGIASPVTKASAGTQYHTQLARQLADFLSSTPGGRQGARSLIDRFGGMMTLPDVFSVFNRARGTELVSPSDLLMTAQLLQSYRLGMSLRRFDSGVLVIQSDSHSDKAMAERLVGVAKASEGGGGDGWGNGVGATQVARDLRVSVTLALEHLHTAEAAGRLCRDDSVEGTRFFVNHFDEFVEELEESRRR